MSTKDTESFTTRAVTHANRPLATGFNAKWRTHRNITTNSRSNDNRPPSSLLDSLALGLFLCAILFATQKLWSKESSQIEDKNLVMTKSNK